MRHSPSALLALGLVVAGCATAATASPAPASLTPSPPASASAEPSATGTSVPSPASPSLAPCQPPGLSARITRWEGAAGSWIVHVEVRNATAASCLLPSAVRPQLVDATAAVLIDSTAITSPPASPGSSAVPPSPGVRTLAAGGTFTAEVRVGNYCGPAPATPLSVAFVLPAGSRLVAAPISTTDDTVPACMGAPGSPGSIEMQPWGL